jgi:hypothetical protein
VGGCDELDSSCSGQEKGAGCCENNKETFGPHKMPRMA